MRAVHPLFHAGRGEYDSGVTKLLGALSFLLLGVGPAWSAPGALDPSFGWAGVVETVGDYPTYVAVQTDAKVLVAMPTGDGRTRVERRSVDGSLDGTYGFFGAVLIDGVVRAVVLDPAGRMVLLVSRSSGSFLARIGTGGARDLDFGVRGWTILSPLAPSPSLDFALAGQRDGKIVVGGRTCSPCVGTLLRFREDGTADEAFGVAGRATIAGATDASVTGLAVQADGRIVAALDSAESRWIARLLPDGEPDLAFGTGGAADAIEQPAGARTDLALRWDGKILMSVYGEVVRYLPDGSLDVGFGAGGRAPVPGGASVIVPQGDRKTILLGSVIALVGQFAGPHTAVSRIDDVGAADPTWGEDGVAVLPLSPTVDLPDSASLAPGRLVFGGSLWGVGGYVAAVDVGEFCGDGIVQPGEDCDAGSFVEGSCCTHECTFEPATTACPDDGIECTSDVCDGAGACLHPSAPAGTACTDDGIECTADRCESGTCVHPPVADGTPCDDGSVCLVDETCTSGVCGGGIPDGVGCPQPFVCYATKRSMDGPKFEPVPGIELADAIESGTFDLRKTSELCVPADVESVEVADGEERQVSYKIKASPGQAKHRKRRVVVEDALGTHWLDTKKPAALFAAADLELGGPATPPAPGASPHYKCYTTAQSKGFPKFGSALVSAADEFEDRSYQIFAPKRLCFAADVSGEGIIEAGAVLTCYRARRGPGEPRHERIEDLVHTADQFGSLQVDTKRVSTICLPAREIP